MKRKIVQDVVLKRSPQLVRLEEKGEPVILVPSESKSSRVYTFMAILAGSILLLGLFIILSSNFSKVSLKVTTTKKDITLDELVTLNSDGSNDAIKYELMKINGTGSLYVPTTGSKVVQKYAAGSATIYNAFSPSPQKLIAGTRLSTKDGKIYKIQTAVTIPGMTTLGGKNTPGTTVVSIKASETGVKYNIPPSDFTIPGFQGTDKFLKITAKNTKDISGGWSGELKIANPADIQKTRQILEDGLKTKLIKNASTQVPKGYLLYDDSMFISYSDNSIDGNSLIAADGDKMNMQVNAVLNAVIFKSEDLKQLVISRRKADLTNGNQFIIADLDKLSFKILNKDKINSETGSPMTVKLNGKLSIIWDFNSDELKNKLIGIRKSIYQDVLKDYPAIEKAEATFSPSWTFYFPNDASRIEIDKGF